MAESLDSEQGSESPTAGHNSDESNGFVHVESSVDSAQMGGSSVDPEPDSQPLDHVDEDNGVVVTGGDAVQDESNDVKITDDGGKEEFVDCSEELNAFGDNKEAIDSSEAEQKLGDDDEATRSLASGSGVYDHDLEHREATVGKTIGEGETNAQEYEEERRSLKNELANLHHELHTKNQEIMNLHAIINENSVSREASSNAQFEKDRDIEASANRVLASLATVFRDEELFDESLHGKMSRVESYTSFLTEKYNYFLSEMELLGQCLTAVNSDLHVQAETDNIFLTAHDELLKLKNKEVELAHEISRLEDENRKLAEQVDKGSETIHMANGDIGKLRGELEQEKIRYGNTKEKLSMAVTKGKALLQQRDSLKQSLADKTSELEKCLIELQEKSSALKAAELRMEDLIKGQTLAESLKEALSLKDSLLGKCEEIISLSGATEDILSLDMVERVTWLVNERNALAIEIQKLTDALSTPGFPESMLSSNLESRINWLFESYYLAKDEASKLTNEIARTREAASNEIDRLTAVLLVETQEKNYLREELEDLTRNYEGVLEKEHEVSLEKEKMVNILLMASGIAIDDQDDMTMVFERCIGKIKEQTAASLESSHLEAEILEKLQTHLFIRDQESMLYEKILEEEFFDKSEMTKQLNEFVVVSEELRALKDEKGSLQDDLQRSEDKAALLREKLSMAVKKGKGLVQERENMKQLLAEKNALIETLKVESQQQESAISDCRDQISKLSADVERIPKLETDLVAGKEVSDRLEQFLMESNSMLQRVIESIDGIVTPVNFQEPAQKVKWLAESLSECQDAKTHAEQELNVFKNETNDLASKLAEVETTMKSLEDALSVAERDRSQLIEEKRELEIAKTNVAEELLKAIEEAASHASKLSVAERNCFQLTEETRELELAKTNAEEELQKAMEEAMLHSSKLSVAERDLLLLTEEKRELESAKTNVEVELQKVKEEATSHANKFAEAGASRNSLEEALTVAENSISMLVKEKDDARAGIVAAEAELDKVKEEFSVHTSKLNEAYKTIQLHEDAISQLQNDIALLTKENDKLQVGQTTLEDEIKKLKEETDSQASKLVDASSTIKSLEDTLFKAEQEISTLNLQLTACMEELDGKRDSKSLEISGYLDRLHLVLKDETPLTLLRQSFEKEIDSLKHMDQLLKDVRDSIVKMDSELLQNYPASEDKFSTLNILPAGGFDMSNIETFNGKVDDEGIASYIGKTAESFHLRDKFLADKMGSSSTCIDELLHHLLTNLMATRDSLSVILENMKFMQKKLNNMEVDTQSQEKISNVLLSACTGATQELKFEVENNQLELESVLEEQEGWNHSLEEDAVEGSEYVKVAEELLSAARYARSLIKHLQNVKNTGPTTIGELQSQLEKIRLNWEQAEEEKETIRSKASKLENDLQLSQNVCHEMRYKLEEYQTQEDTWKGREAELMSMQTTKEHETQDSLLSAAQIESLFNKINKIDIPSSKLEVGELEPQESVHVKKLFYIIDSVNELQHQLSLLSLDKEELQSTLSKQAHEVENLKEEVDKHIKDKQESEELRNELFDLSVGLENIIQKLGGNESASVKKSAVAVDLLPVLERLVIGSVMECENSKSKAQDLEAKLLGTQKVVDELAGKVKLLEDSNQKTTASPVVIQERGTFEAPSVPARSEISEIEDVGPIGKPAIPPLPTAAHARTLRKGSGSNDQLAIDIDLESNRLIDNEETNEDKGHVFKSLNTSGIVPVQGKMIADRLDGIWVSGGRALMSRPRARLGLIAYWLVLHIWLLGTIL